MTAPASRWSALSLLIVDDEPGMRSFLAKALARRFAQIETAASVEEAEALRCRLHFDLIIADIRLPGRSGIEWHEAIDPATRRSDIIFMTGFMLLLMTHFRIAYFCVFIIILKRAFLIDLFIS